MRLGWIPLAITRGDIADYVYAIFLVYIILIFVRVLMSWIPRIPYSSTLRPVLDFITDTTDPYLNVFRRILPPIGGGGMAIDLSPILGIVVLFIAQGLIVSAIHG
jgi:YggT family protein